MIQTSDSLKDSLSKNKKFSMAKQFTRNILKNKQTENALQLILQMKTNISSIERVPFSGPQPFWDQGLFSCKTIFPRTRGGGMVLG